MIQLNVKTASYQSADSNQSKAVPPPPPGGGLLCFKRYNNKLMLLLLLFVLHFKTQLGLLFEGGIESADLKQLFIHKCRLYI